MSNTETTITSPSCNVNFFEFAAKTLAIYAVGAGVVLLIDASRGATGRVPDAVVTSAYAANVPAPQAQGEPGTALTESPAVAHFPDGYRLNATEIEAPIRLLLAASGSSPVTGPDPERTLGKSVATYRLLPPETANSLPPTTGRAIAAVDDVYWLSAPVFRFMQ